MSAYLPTPAGYATGLPNFQPWAVNLYQPPTCKAEAFLRSTVNSHIYSNFESTVRKIMPGGKRTDAIYKAGNLAVAIKAGIEPTTGIFLYPGQWLDLASFVIGRDILELFASINGLPYRTAIAIFAHQFDCTGPAPMERQCAGLAEMVQERKPLYIPALPIASIPPNARVVLYRNAVGVPVALAAQQQLPDGDDVTTYFSLWRRRDGNQCHWVETFPQKPLMLFHLDQISQCPYADATLMPDEFSAEDAGAFQPTRVYTAILGGYDNILGADLTPLSGRTVHVVLRHEDLRLLKVIAQRLAFSGVVAPTFSLNLNGWRMTFAEIEALAVERGHILIEPSTDPVASAEVKGLVAVPAEAFVEMNLPQRGYVLDPIIPEQGLGMLHGPRGTGKTHFALGIANAVATGGSFLGWQAPKAQPIAYIDGEMSASLMKERLEAAANSGAAWNGHFRLVTPDLQEGNMPDISTPEGRAAIEAILDGVALLVLDNLSTLCRSGRENDSDAWAEIQGWLLDLRRRGISVLIVHHSGKKGGQRGTSRREDVLDTVIGLRRPDDYCPSQGARFEVHFEKARGLVGDDVKPFEVWLKSEDGVMHWAKREIADDQMDAAEELFRGGLSVRDVGREMGISRSAAGRLRQKIDGLNGAPDSEQGPDDEDID